MLRELIPSDLFKIQSPNDWKRLIVAAYNQDAGMTPEDAKVTFLKVVYRYALCKIYYFEHIALGCYIIIWTIRFFWYLVCGF